MDVIYNSDGNVNGPKGVRGGGEGACAHQHKLDRNGAVVAIANVARITLADGELVASYSCGGGGYGPPFARDAELVRRDVAEGYISRARARDVYGVAIDDGGAVIYAETEKLRARDADGA